MTAPAAMSTPPAAKPRRRWGPLILSGPSMIWYAAFFVLPILWIVLYSFGTNAADQASPMCSPGPLTLGSNGNFYGTYCAVIFQITPEGEETILHTMTAAEGHNIANILLQANDGNFYGVATTGGANNAGTVFKLEVPGSH